MCVRGGDTLFVSEIRDVRRSPRLESMSCDHMLLVLATLPATVSAVVHRCRVVTRRSRNSRRQLADEVNSAHNLKAITDADLKL